MQLRFPWRYLVLAVDGQQPKLKWVWIEQVRQRDLLPVLQSWKPDAIVWDSASSHKGRAIAQSVFRWFFCPPTRQNSAHRSGSFGNCAATWKGSFTPRSTPSNLRLNRLYVAWRLTRCG